MLELNLLGLRQAESTGYIGERLLGKDDSGRPHGANFTGELHVFDGFGKELQTTAVLLEEAEPGAIELTVDEQTNEAFVPEARREGEFTLGDVEGRLSIAKLLIMEPRYVLVRRIAHGSVITIEVESAH
ncbi:MAG TPA: hypothetical protein VFR80_12865 [Pyrinomonadaceae bacterium]|nr:hypothetical protein [Pyrinomonadaceae bacterium]